MAVKFVMTDEQVNELKRRITEHKKNPGPLMPSLHDAQEIFGCIPIEIQKIISKELDESIAKINGVVTFYSHFTIEPKGKHVVNVCLGTACYVRGAQQIVSAINELLKINPGETTEDGNFSFNTSRCIGACGLAPVFTIDGNVFGSADPTLAKKELMKTLEEK